MYIYICICIYIYSIETVCNISPSESLEIPKNLFKFLKKKTKDVSDVQRQGARSLLKSCLASYAGSAPG